MTNLSSKLLIASPHLQDGNFFRTVVFLLRHDQEGAFGLVLNRPTERRFQQFIELSSASASGMGQATAREDDWIYSGGPVGGPLLALHDLAGVGEPVGLPVTPNMDGTDPELLDSTEQGEEPVHVPGSEIVVHDNPAEPWGSMSIHLSHPPAWVTGDEDHLRLLHQRRDIRVRYVSDYSGWGAGQLEAEMHVGGWLTCQATPELVFAGADKMWQACVDRCGRDVLGAAIPGVHSVSSMVN